LFEIETARHLAATEMLSIGIPVTIAVPLHRLQDCNHQKVLADQRPTKLQENSMENVSHDPNKKTKDKKASSYLPSRYESHDSRGTPYVRQGISGLT